MAKMNSRWRKGAVRYSGDRVVESSHWVRDPLGGKRRVVKAVTEVLFVLQGHEPYGWKNGAKVRKV